MRKKHTACNSVVHVVHRAGGFLNHEAGELDSLESFLKGTELSTLPTLRQGSQLHPQKPQFFIIFPFLPYINSNRSAFLCAAAVAVDGETLPVWNFPPPMAPNRLGSLGFPAVKTPDILCHIQISHAGMTVLRLLSLGQKSYFSMVRGCHFSSKIF